MALNWSHFIENGSNWSRIVKTAPIRAICIKAASIEADL
jgi:hypothetical protein